MTLANSTWVVDDQADFRFLIQQLFTRYLPQYPLRLFDSGQTLINELTKATQPPGLILLDRHMPELDGHQILLWLKAQPEYKKIPVVMLCADASRQEINACYQAGVESFLTKTFDFVELTQMIKRVCQHWLDLNHSPIDR